MSRILHTLTVASSLLAAVSFSRAAAPGPSRIVLRPADGELERGDTLRISFPTAMVSTAGIDVKTASPIAFEPEIDGAFLWKSQTEGEHRVEGPVRPGTRYAVRLRRGLVDAGGAPVAAPDWRPEFETAPFAASVDWEERERLESRPQVWISFNYPVRVPDAVPCVFFQNRDTRERLPAEAMIWETRKEAALERAAFAVTPRAPLPPGATFDLLIEGVRDAGTGTSLPLPAMYALGTTRPLELSWVGAMHHALDRPHIRLHFQESIDPETVGHESIVVEPAPPNLRLLSQQNEIRVEGDFDTKRRYRVTVTEALRGWRGFALAKPALWGATFGPRQCSVVFPGARINQRSALGLRFSFIQSNTPELTWKLAAIPPEKLAAVQARVREFTQDARDPADGTLLWDAKAARHVQRPTEILVDAFALSVVAAGTFPASAPDDETLRELRWKPENGAALAGAHLLEITGRTPEGRVVGNRSVLCFSELILTQKRSPAKLALRVAGMADGLPVAGVRVRAVTAENIELASGATDPNGMVFLPVDIFKPEFSPGGRRSAESPVSMFVMEVTRPDGVLERHLQFASDERFPSGYPGGSAAAAGRTLRGHIVTDRPLYRPGETVKIKGFIRVSTSGNLQVPTGEEVVVSVQQGYEDEPIHETRVTVSPHGGWETEWIVPGKAKLGLYRVAARLGALETQERAHIKVEEFRVPLYSVQVAPAERPSAGEDAIRIVSRYFHGAPNARAAVRWTSTWHTADDWDYETLHDDQFSEGAKTRAYMGEASGETRLDADGVATVTLKPPFADRLPRARCFVTWKIDVSSVEGQTITGGLHHQVQLVPAAIGIRLEQARGPERGLVATVDAVDGADAAVAGVPVAVDLFRIENKTVREEIAPFVFRHETTKRFTRVGRVEGVTPARVPFAVTQPGEYVAVAARRNAPATPRVSAREILSGGDYAELEVRDDSALALTTSRPSYRVGETASIAVESPFAGVAWVSVENEEILDTHVARLEGNAGRIELPIKAEYAPNATVSVYLVRPGGATGLPLERFGTRELRVERPELALAVELPLDRARVEPGDMISGKARVLCQGKPVADAELTLFAVDDAILRLGSWTLPDLLPSFYPARAFRVATFAALRGLVDSIDRRSLFEKGFVLGDGGEDLPGQVDLPRKHFKPLAFWNARLLTAQDGTVAFEFAAPDNLTTFRVVGLAQTAVHQFGAGSAEVKVAKSLMAEPALPRFLRARDEIELRLIVRQPEAGRDATTTRCVCLEGLDLLGPDTAEGETTAERPVIARFRARAHDGAAHARVRFEARSQTDPQRRDSVELTLPIHPPTILRRETVGGAVSGATLDFARVAPPDWMRGEGAFRLALSTSPWFPKLNGLPRILDYPHGCFEQIGTRLLAYSLLSDLLAFLPDSRERLVNHRPILERAFALCEESITEDGFLPYWAGSDRPNAFVTSLFAWVTHLAARADIPVPERLAGELPEALERVATGKLNADPFNRALALMVLSERGAGREHLAGAAENLYLRRETMSDEGRALLALALHTLGLMPDARDQLLREINVPIVPRAFDPTTFTSATRAEAMQILARARVGTIGWSAKDRGDATARLLAVMDSSADLSTQENLWTLLAFRALLDPAQPARLPEAGLDPKPDLVSTNGASACWGPAERAALSRLALRLDPATGPLTYLLSGVYRLSELQTDRVDRGFRVERTLKNLTDPKRDGSAGAPLRLGDEVLVTYRVLTEKLQHYVALEDQLPAALETINPSLPAVAQFYRLPPGVGGDIDLGLSHSELRDHTTLLYFDRIEPGHACYSVLARATSAGTFIWPATQVAPMYDARFSGLSPSSTVVVRAQEE